MPSKLTLFNWLAKHGDNSIDELLEILSRPGALQKDAARYFGEPDSIISKFVSNNIVWHPVLHPELREACELYLSNKYDLHKKILRREAQVLRLK